MIQNRLRRCLNIIRLISAVLMMCGISCRSSPGTYYVDSRSGEDHFDGRTPAGAWKSIARLNRTHVRPGDRILFKRNSRWGETLMITHSGTEKNPIVYDAYGEGNKPVIAAWDTLTGGSQLINWIPFADSIWYLESGTDPRRIWIDGVEDRRAGEPGDMSRSQPWHYDPVLQRLYIYAHDNPARQFREIRAATTRDAAVIARGTSHIKIGNLAIEGGATFSLHLEGCTDIEVENCEVGKNSGKYGIFVSNSTNGIIRECQVDSWHQLRYDTHYMAVEDGVKLYNGCNYWKIYRNEIKNWGHSGIQIQTRDPQESTSHNEIFSNIISAPDVSYCRGFEITGPPGSCQYNQFYRNIVRFTTVRNQVGGEHNLIHHNIFHDIQNVSYRSDGTAQVISFSNHEGNACHDIGFYHNVLVDSDEPAIRVVSHGGPAIHNIEIKNNIVYRGGRASREGISGVQLWIAPAEDIQDLKIEYNNFFDPEREVVIFYRGLLKEVSQLNPSYLRDGDIVSNNLFSDPLFMSLTDRNLQLQPGSPCIGGGIAVGIEPDFSGKTIPIEGKVDIGAFQFDAPAD